MYFACRFHRVAKSLLNRQNSAFSVVRFRSNASIRSFPLLRSMLINQNPLKRTTLNDTDFQAVLDRNGVENTTFLVSSGGNGVFLDQGEGVFSQLFLSRAELPAPPSLSDGHTYIYMGSRGERAYVAMEVADPAPYLALAPNTAHKSLRDVSERIEDTDAVALLAQACGLATWHARTKHCTKCGSPLLSARSGAARKCTNVACAVHSYPRIEPAVIQLIQSPCGGYALLGRKKVWPAGRYSCLAGFVEIGETLEQCVVRETMEEAGVLTDIDSVKYLRSQPWPFPSSLMLGYMANAVGEVGTLPAIDVDETEMEAVKWFSRKDVCTALGVDGSTSLDMTTTNIAYETQTLSLPGTSSLARSLIAEWATKDLSLAAS